MIENLDKFSTTKDFSVTHVTVYYKAYQCCNLTVILLYRWFKEIRFKFVWNCIWIPFFVSIIMYRWMDVKSCFSNNNIWRIGTGSKLYQKNILYRIVLQLSPEANKICSKLTIFILISVESCLKWITKLMINNFMTFWLF